MAVGVGFWAGHGLPLRVEMRGGLGWGAGFGSVGRHGPGGVGVGLVRQRQCVIVGGGV
ncbi:MAG: hypothetical protein H0T78_13035 [Longispora sp.]|nr:hypothetical protein [Longispora sp. (in: high G+C Gram-positive bacteria)]